MANTRKRYPNITHLHIPEGISELGIEAFLGCEKMTEMKLPKSLINIGKDAFSGCPKGCKIVFSKKEDEIKTTDNYAFGLVNGTEIKGSDKTFKVELGPQPSPVEWFTFSEPDASGNVSLTKFTYSEGREDVVIPDNDDKGNKVTSIGEYAFTFCSSLTSVTIPSSVTSIGEFAFNTCSSLTSVTIPEGVTSIGSNVFEYCSSLTSVTIPSSVTSIGKFAFNTCSSLTSVTIPSSVTFIGGYAFTFCSSLTSVTINTPSDKTITINNSEYSSSFNDCPKLTSVTFTDKTKEQVMTMANGKYWGLKTGTIIHCKGGETITVA